MKLNKIDFWLTFWILINLIQAIFTPITGDEAYYWTFSEHPNFGYFDHPPLTAWLIYLGNLFIDGIVGIRLFTILISALSLKVIWLLIPSESRNNENAEQLFMILICLSPIFNIYSFITTPDAVLLLFSSLFLLSVKRLQTVLKLSYFILFTLSAAGLFYAKYHGAIVILLVLIVFPFIWKNWQFYLCGTISFLLVLPHFYWQFNHDWVTIKFHIFERGTSSFEIAHLVQFITNTFIILNPGLVIYTLYLAFKSRLNDHSTLKLFVGFVLFFFIFSMRGRTEAHWVAFAAIPITVLVFNQLSSSGFDCNLFRKLSKIGLVLVIVARLFIVLPLPFKTEFHVEKQEYFESIAEIAQQRTVVFVNSYQRAAKYTYFTRKPAISDNLCNYRKNQFDFSIIKQKTAIIPVLYVTYWHRPNFNALPTRHDTLYYQKIDSFPLYNGIKTQIKTLSLNELSLSPNISISLVNQLSDTISFYNSIFPIALHLCSRSPEIKYVRKLNVSLPNFMSPLASEDVVCTIDPNGLPKSKEQYFIALNRGPLESIRISNYFTIYP